MKKLSLLEIQSITFGVDSVIEEQHKFYFFRMKDKTAEDFDIGDWQRRDFKTKCYTTAGVFWDFYTDSKSVVFSYCDVIKTSDKRPWYFFDILVNGNHVGSAGEEVAEKFSGTYELLLDGKRNRVAIYFPCLVLVKIKELQIEDGALIEPVHKSKKILYYGDSITQGYDSYFSSMTFASIVAREKNMNALNIGVGGSFFEPKILNEKYDGDYVIVAYGTNDWSNKTKGQFVADSSAFFERLVQIYNNKKIYYILPIWRDTTGVSSMVGTFEEGREILKEIVKLYPQIKCIDAYDFVPHHFYYFTDKTLHPNSSGFQHYAEHLLKELDF